MTKKVYPRYREGKIPECGTKAGYDYHTRQAMEDSCEPCRDAMKTYWVERRKVHGKEITKARRIREDNNPLLHRTNRSRAMKAGNDFDFYTTKEVIDKYGTICYLCNEEIDMEANRRVGSQGWERGLHIDHVYPISKGGSDTLDNVRPAHGRCNIVKWATIKETNE